MGMQTASSRLCPLVWMMAQTTIRLLLQLAFGIFTVAHSQLRPLPSI